VFAHRFLRKRFKKKEKQVRLQAVLRRSQFFFTTREKIQKMKKRCVFRDWTKHTCVQKQFYYRLLDSAHCCTSSSRRARERFTTAPLSKGASAGSHRFSCSV
jgi:hypothetical protein